MLARGEPGVGQCKPVDDGRRWLPAQLIAGLVTTSIFSVPQHATPAPAEDAPPKTKQETPQRTVYEETRKAGIALRDSQALPFMTSLLPNGLPLKLPFRAFAPSRFPFSP